MVPKPEGVSDEARFPELTGAVRTSISLLLKSIAKEAASGIMKRNSQIWTNSNKTG